MTTAARYLESKKLDEIAGQLRGEGYEVVAEPSGPHNGYDLIATKLGKRIAVEVRAGSALRGSAQEIKTLRRKAQEEGFDEFRLVVANPPHETAIEIEGLGRELTLYIENHIPNELLKVSGGIVPRRVGGIEFDLVTICRNSVRVAGSAVVNLEIPFTQSSKESSAPIDESIEPGYSAGSPVFDDEGIDWIAWEVDLPFSFEVELNRELKITRAQRLNVDLSSLTD